ncbi:MAG TPA: hypothetical protein VG820_06695 [Fimbriimonadaceae bacterium]|nr:hypothetical protein [Fimbriimonadaceae bacterium]
MNWNHVIEALPYVIALMAFVIIRLVRVLTAHQQKMAEILNRTNDDRADITALRREIAELKALVHENVIAADDSRRLTSPPPAPDLADRLRGR